MSDGETDKVGTDPLMVLRHFVSHKKEIVETTKEFVFGDIAYYKDAKTNFPIFQVDSKGDVAVGEDGQGLGKKEREYYSVESLKFFVDHATMPHTLYIKRVVRENEEKGTKLQVICRPDRTNLLNYLQGKVTKCEGVDPDGPMQLPMPAPRKDKGPFDEGESGVSGTLKFQSEETASATSEQWLSVSNREKFLTMQPLPEAKSLFSRRDVGYVADALADVKITTGLQSSEGCKSVEIPDSTTEFDAHPGTMSLEKVIGKEKLEELQRKRREKKVHEVGNLNDLWRDEYNPAAAGYAIGDLKLPHEREHNTRNSILRSQNRDFLSSVSRILKGLDTAIERKEKFGPGYVTPAPWDPKKTGLSASAKMLQVVRGDTTPYNRYDQKEKLPAETTEFGINPLQSFSTGLADGVKKTLAAKLEADKLVPGRHATSSPPTKRLRRDLTPIIIVPDGPPSLISILNIKDILGDGTFVPHEQKKASGERKMNEVIIHRTKPGGIAMPYKVMTYPEKLSIWDWDRVVAVFVHGKTWQFKGWPYDGNPVIICTRFNAFSMKYDDAEADPNVKQWPVKIINISRQRRHLDKAAVVGFWSAVETFIAANKPFLIH